MNDKKRFYIEKVGNIVYLHDRSRGGVVYAGPDYLNRSRIPRLEEICDLLNKGHEAAEASPIDVEELREQQRAYGYRLFNTLVKRVDEKSDLVERTYYSGAVMDLCDVISSGKCLTRSSDKIKEG